MLAAFALVAQVILTSVRLVLLGVAVAVAGWAAALALLRTDIPWTAVVFGAAYLAAGTWLLVVAGQHLTRRWTR